ncbi:MAG: hypothetical protein CMP22_07650 [Rickettsiales bacterium]|nr:hypothetical protein [Rickettsiales bacterium]|tara:strand:- start:591 stop:1049 length:459 start_codon:yes stop_codon:yes gene_type:complete
MSWTDERVKKLKELWVKDVTAEIIGNKLGVSKNAIIGKARRMGLKKRKRRCKVKVDNATAQRASPNTIRIKKNKADIQEIKKPVQEKSPKKCAVIPPGAKSLIDVRNNECRWPVAEGPFLFCSKKIHRGSFCEEHANRAYRRTPEVNEDGIT